LLALAQGEPDVTLAEIEARVLADRQFKTTDRSILRFFLRRGVSYKKNAARQRAAPVDVAKASEEWTKALPTLDQARLDFVDEASTSRRGSLYDNPTAESFMKTLKVEAVYPIAYKSFAEVGPSAFHRRGLQRPPSPLRSGPSQPASARKP
jgi:hypothetical protein